MIAQGQTIHVQTDWISLGIFLVSILAIFGGLARWMIGRLDKYTDRVAQRLDKMDTHLAEQDVKIARIEGVMNMIRGRGRRE